MTALATAMRSALAAAADPERAPRMGLLYANIEPNLPEKDFFIRKSIGWALRAYAWTDPKEVARYVGANASRLSGLSRREAQKNVNKR